MLDTEDGRRFRVHVKGSQLPDEQVLSALMNQRVCLHGAADDLRGIQNRNRKEKGRSMKRLPHTSSLRPVLADPAARIKDAAFTLVTRSPKLHAQSIRTARWRFTRWTDGQTELYDHDADPEELQNVSAQHPDVAAELTARIQKLPALPLKP